jgi:Gas vesicle synthesis protein GvpL/GvpF
MGAEGRCVWIYAVAADGEEPSTGSSTGVGGGQVRAVGAAGLTAIVGDVGEPEFGETALRRNLEDLDWLERTARAHHAVIKAAAAQRPVVPMQFATVYASDDGVVQTLRQRSGDFREALSRITARSEWGVKAYAAEPADAGTGDGQASPAAGPGAAYLQRRREQLTAHRTARREAMASAQAVHAELARRSVSARLYPPQSPDLAGRPTPMVLNAAYLVADERAGEFAAAVKDLTGGHRSVRLALTGPWPAYSFVGAQGQQ